MKKKILLVPLALLLAVSLIAIGCPAPAPAPAPATTPAPAPAPAPEQEVIKWVVCDTFAAGNALSWSGEIITQTVKDLCRTPNYRLEFEYHYGAEMFPMGETFEAAKTGAIDAAVGWPGFLKGTNTALVLFGSFPCSYTPEDFAIWYYYAGGKELCDEMYGKYDMKPFAVGGGTIEGGMWSHFKMEKPEDFAGLKIRTPGFSEDIIDMMGATTVGISPDEIYLAMDRGVIDAAEFTFPCGDVSIHLEEVAEYYIAPAWWQTAMITLLAVNTNTWNELPDELKPLLEYAAKVSYLISYAKWDYSNIDAIRQFEDAGTKITKLSEEAILALEEHSCHLAELEAAKNPDFLKVAKSLYNFMKAYQTWRYMAKPYGQGCVHEVWPNFVDEDPQYPWMTDKNNPEYYAIFEK